MRVNSVELPLYNTYGIQPPVAEERKAPAPQEPPAEPRSDKNDLAATFERSVKDNDTSAQSKQSGPADHSGALTRRLVTAKYQGEVHSIISEAYKNLTEWMQAAMNGDSKAMAAVKRLQKLIRRASRKVSDLNKEDAIRLKQQRAEKQMQEQLAQELRAELKRKTLERTRREQSYLRDGRSQSDGKSIISNPSIAVLEAKIMALAQSMAQMASISIGGMESGEISASVEGGGEIGEVPAIE